MPTTTRTSIEDARDRIDDIDRQLIELLGERYAIVDEICETKTANGETVKDPNREEELLERIASIAEENDLSPEFAERLYQDVLSHSVARQKRQREEGAVTSVPAHTTTCVSGEGNCSSNGRDLPSPSSSAQPVPPPNEKAAERGYHRVARTDRDRDTVVSVGDALLGQGGPVLIAGPCSVESREQILRSAEAVAHAGGHLLRGGCFKPRTSPYSFQGLGEEGLDLMVKAGRRFGLPIITEVLAPGDVEAVAARADVLQIGSRNMQNYPLLKEVGRSNRPAMLKRGMMASVEEWLSAAEYIVTHGNPNVILCERGIKTFESATRYTLDLTSVPVIKERSHLPVLVDPSHAAGTRRWVPSLVEAALGVGADGVMVEAHPNPEEAMSDGAQSLTLDTLSEIGNLFAPRSA